MIHFITYICHLIVLHLEKIINSVSKLFLFFVLFSSFSNAQTVFHTEDIAIFYEAFDKVHASTDKKQQLEIVQKNYIDKGSYAVKYVLAKSSDGFKGTSKDYLEMVLNDKIKLERIRPYLNNIESQKKILEQKFLYFKELYPDFKDGHVYLTIGLDIFGGRADGSNLIIGCEIMAKDKPDWAVSIVLHEYVHTLQKMSYNALLADSIMEGAADFIAELVNQKSLKQTYPNGYIDFGSKNDKVIWTEFKKVIASNEKGNFFDWLYGSKGITINETKMNDLGYYIGYAICKNYYDNSKDKKQAVKDIIELDVSKDEYAKQFLIKSGYVPKEDTEFIKNLKFTKVVLEKKNIEMKIVGYTIDNDNVIFSFNLPKSFNVSELKQITIAGSFNGWNPNDSNFKMNLLKDNHYQYILPKSKLDKKEYEFKFVINGEQWQSIPENASNTDNGNLTLKVK